MAQIVCSDRSFWAFSKLFRIQSICLGMDFINPSKCFFFISFNAKRTNLATQFNWFDINFNNVNHTKHTPRLFNRSQALRIVVNRFREIYFIFVKFASPMLSPSHNKHANKQTKHSYKRITNLLLLWIMHVFWKLNFVVCHYRTIIEKSCRYESFESEERIKKTKTKKNKTAFSEDTIICCLSVMIKISQFKRCFACVSFSIRIVHLV